MPQETIRLYKGKDVDMITALSTILTNAKANQPDLQKKRTNLTPAYLEDLETRLDGVVKKYFGLDNAGQLRRQTNIVYGIQSNAYKAVSEMSTQIRSSYSDDKIRQKEILTELGYTTWFKAAGNNDTEALIALIYQYQKNMTDELQTGLINAGTPPESITAVISFANALKEANVLQESFKGTKKAITAETVTAYNSLYSEVTGKISKNARIFFPGNLPKQQLFAYTTILKAMNKHPVQASGEAPPVS